MKKVERVQRIATRQVFGMAAKSYWERLKEINVITLAGRRQRGDMIEVHKVLHVLHSVDLSELFVVKPNRQRGSAFSLQVIQAPLPN